MMNWEAWQAIAAVVGLCFVAIGSMYKLFANHLHEVRDQIEKLEDQLTVERNEDRRVARGDMETLRQDIRELRDYIMTCPSRLGR